MAPEPVVTLSVLRTLTAGLGTFIVIYAARAWIRTRSRVLLWFTGGVALLTAAFLVEGILYQVLGWPLARVAALGAGITLVAFAMLVVSLLVRDLRRAPKPPETREENPAPGT